ncbi:uncharacterized protein N7496_009456 [Penicillium cataractarum]|uniref:Uncharacterized protein n=1 Tax=Penicillium cataractarum TaxID=2100454 RepID=A0A9W9UZX9_9EURO|nr:uncharacterized protein N7496_009456 [Penicillium cataractarum]KAJ5363743.1 hypothetical protein N7496_009456 [Penicillium cataractarum]
MSAPGGAPSPAPRGGSMGPGANGGNMPMSSQQPMSGTPVHSAPPLVHHLRRVVLCHNRI